MDIQQYLAKKDAGLATLIRVDDHIELHIKRFNPETGSETIPVTFIIDTVVLEERKNSLMDEIEKIDIVLNDISLLD